MGLGRYTIRQGQLHGDQHGLLIMMRALDQSLMLAQDLSLGGHDDPVGIDPQAHRAVGEGGRDAVAVALEADQTGRRDALALLDEAIEGGTVT